MIELACIIAVVTLAVVSEVRQGRSDARFQAERSQWSRERETLLQRIQAPEVAVVQHQVAEAVDRPAVNLEDDSDYWKAQQEAMERMEQLEREFEARVG